MCGKANRKSQKPVLCKRWQKIYQEYPVHLLLWVKFAADDILNFFFFSFFKKTGFDIENLYERSNPVFKKTGI